MQSPKDIQAIKDICSGRKIDLPHKAGLYAFWWLGLPTGKRCWTQTDRSF